jgi:guanine deaminase
VRAPEESTLQAVLRHSPSADATLGALFTLAREDAVAEVRVAGERIVSGETGAAPVAAA